MVDAFSSGSLRGEIIVPDEIDPDDSAGQGWSGMRLVSNLRSVTRGEVSVLAIAETLAAIALVFFLSAYFNTLRWLACAICFAPLLLLRTQESTKVGIEWIDRWYKSWMDPFIKEFRDRLPLVCLFLGISIGLSLAGLTIRIGSTVWASIRHPVLSLQAIPTNWWRVVLAMDSRFAPELIPGHRKFDLTRQSRGMFWRDASWIAFFTIVFFPALFYRWSLKATSIIYAPLVFIMHTTFRFVPDLKRKLELVTRSDVTRILALYAMCYVAAFLVKVVLMMSVAGFEHWWSRSPARQLAAIYVAPTEIPKWQVASLTNCALALGAWLFARHALLRIKVGAPWRETVVVRALGFVTGLRTVLALYTIACTGYLTLRAARGWHWPALGEKWLPWP